MIFEGSSRWTFRQTAVEDEQGNALLAALMVSMLLAVLALSMSSNIMTDFSTGRDLESQKTALQTADTGNSVLKNSLLRKRFEHCPTGHHLGSPLYQLHPAHPGIGRRQLFSAKPSGPSGSDECGFRKPSEPHRNPKRDRISYPRGRCLTGFRRSIFRQNYRQ